MNFDSPYIFSFISEKADSGNIALDYSQQPMSIWKKVLVMDSIFDFYPSIEIVLPDDFGLLSDGLVMMEGMSFDTKLGNKETGEFITHKYVVQKNELIDPKVTTHLSGDVLLSLTSYHNLLDIKNSMAWEKTISEIVTELGKDVLKVSTTIIEDTTGEDVWYQINETVETFLKRKMAPRALSQSNATSPYITFINCQGELYFSSIDKLFKQNTINDKDHPYKFSFEKDQSYDLYAIKNFYTMQGGLDVNKENYNKKTFYRDKSGVVNVGTAGDGELSKISEHIVKGDGKVLFRKDLITNTIGTDFDDYGIYEDKEKDFYAAFKNSLFIDSTMYLRMEITINFNPLAVSGKTILLKLVSNLKEKSGSAMEYDGTWLILGSRHFYDVDQAPFTRLIIAKSRIMPDSIHPFGKRFLS